MATPKKIQLEKTSENSDKLLFYLFGIYHRPQKWPHQVAKGGPTMDSFIAIRQTEEFQSWKSLINLVIISDQRDKGPVPNCWLDRHHDRFFGHSLRV